MKFQYEDVHAIFCDEISMVGSMKLAKINFRLQDLADGAKSHEFMGGISFVASGNYNQIHCYSILIYFIMENKLKNIIRYLNFLLFVI